MAHIMLPLSSEYKSRKDNGSSYWYADSALDGLLKELEKSGAHRHNIIAKMVGGARMFPLYNNGSTGIGEQIIRCTRELLKNSLIPIASMDVGGSHGRSAEFHVHSRKIIVTAIGKEALEI